jgi:hypothetical protein
MGLPNGSSCVENSDCSSSCCGMTDGLCKTGSGLTCKMTLIEI